ncbi:MAG TPA: ATP-binding cassette domain-containing protein [Chitinispirillaceae bacterium]|nr:ATP-binding cassette domain-containing protein [Chitinispirillaceae bacterium]
MSIINLSSLTKIYDGFTAVNDVNIQIEQGEILGLIGHNGAGKTTTIKIMVGLLAPTAGKVEVMGQDMSRDSTRVKQSIGYLSKAPLCTYFSL